MKSLAFIFLAGIAISSNSYATKILCHGEDSDRDDEPGFTHEYIIGLEFDEQNRTATIWERRDNEPVMINEGDLSNYNGQVAISYNTIKDLKLTSPVDPENVDWSELPSLINWDTYLSACFLRVEATGFFVREHGTEYVVTYDQDGTFFRNPSDACTETKIPKDHNARIGVICVSTDGNFSDLIGR